MTEAAMLSRRHRALMPFVTHLGMESRLAMDISYKFIVCRTRGRRAHLITSSNAKDVIPPFGTVGYEMA